MSVATTTALAIGGIAAAGVGGGLAYAGQKGVANSEKSAAQLQAEEAANSLAFQEKEFNTEQTNEAPFLKAGQGAVTNLSSLLAPGGDLSKSWTGEFTAPTAADAEATPGYQFQLQQGQQALERSAAARGGVLSGGTAKALDQYSQGLASTNYQQTYNNALTQYQQSYNQFQQDQANLFNRNASLAGLGQTTASTLGQAGQAAANNVTSTNLQTGAEIGQDTTNAAAANASGYNAVGNTLGTSANNIAQQYYLSNLLNPQPSSQSLDNLPTTPSYGV